MSSRSSKGFKVWAWSVAVSLVHGATATNAAAVTAFADRVISFESGTTAAVTFDGRPFDQATTALGAPETLTGEDTGFLSVVSLFKPAFFNQRDCFDR